MNVLTIREAVKKMSEIVERHTGEFNADAWPGTQFKTVAAKTDSLAILAMSKAVEDGPEVILRSAARLADTVAQLQVEHPTRLAKFEEQIISAFWQNWNLPLASEELRSVLRGMDAPKRLQVVSQAVTNSTDPEARKVLGSVLPYGLSPLVTGLDAAQLDQLREAFVKKELPGAVKTRELGRELFSNLGALLSFASSVARDFSNPGALRTLEADREARLAAEERLASN